MIPGRVIEVDEDYVYVDVGYKSEGKIPSNEFDTKPQLGETVYVILVRKEGREGQVIVSKRKADEKIFWKDLRIAFDEHKPVQGTIAHKIKGGYEVDLGNDIRAFLPLSKVDVKRPSENSDYVGVQSPFYIDRLYAKGKTNIVVSRRVLLEEQLLKARREAFQRIKVGEVVEGTVKTITDFGAFVDIGGLDALVHVHDLAWNKVVHPKEIVNVGDRLSRAHSRARRKGLHRPRRRQLPHHRRQ
jgi:small subunit ribosomal protein S1